MATGKVVLSTLAAGISDYLIDGYNGFSVPVGDFESFTEKLNLLCNLSEDEYRKISENAIKTAQEYSIENSRWVYKTLQGATKWLRSL